MAVCTEDSSSNLLLSLIVLGLGIKNQFLFRSGFLLNTENEEGFCSGNGYGYSAFFHQYKSVQVTFIYTAVYTIQIISNQLYSDKQK